MHAAVSSTHASATWAGAGVLEANVLGAGVGVGSSAGADGFATGGATTGTGVGSTGGELGDSTRVGAAELGTVGVGVCAGGGERRRG